MPARNIHGLLIAPHLGPANEIHLDWRRFSVVELGYNLRQPAFNRVVHDYYHSMQTVCAELHAAGQRRIGLLMPQHSGVKTHHLWSAAYLHFQCDLKASERLAIHRPAQLTTANVQRWIRAERPAVVVIGGVLYPRTRGEPQFFELPRKRLNLVERHEAMPGIYQDSHRMGATAADQLISQLQRGEFGVPEQPMPIRFVAKLMGFGTGFSGFIGLQDFHGRNPVNPANPDNPVYLPPQFANKPDRHGTTHEPPGERQLATWCKSLRRAWWVALRFTGQTSHRPWATGL